MAPPRSYSTVDSATAVVTAVRHQRKESLQVLEQNAAETRLWLAASIESFKQQILAGSGPRAVANESKPAAKKLKSSNSVLSIEAIEAVKALKVKELQNRLKERGLNVVGVKKVLRRRLLEAMEFEVLAQQSPFESAAVETVASNAMQVSPQSKESLPEKVQPQEDSPAAVPSPQEQEPAQDAAATADDPMEVEVAEEVVAEKEDDAELVDLTGDLAVDDHSDDAVGPSCDNDNDDDFDVSMTEAPAPQPVSEQPTLVENANVKAAAAATKPAYKPASKPAKTSRSPLKMVQSSVQSAIKIFSKSPGKVMWSASKKKQPVPVYLPDTTTENHDGRNDFDSIGQVQAPMSTDDVSPKRVSEPEEPEEETETKAYESGKAGVRLLNTPAIGGSLSSGASGMIAGASALKSSAVKAKNEARKAKLAEIRGKSKPIVSTKPLPTPNEYMNTLSSLKSTGNATLSESKDGKRKLLAAQMREKAAAKFGRLGESSTKAAAPSQPTGMSSSTKPLGSSVNVKPSPTLENTPEESYPPSSSFKPSSALENTPAESFPPGSSVRPLSALENLPAESLSTKSTPASTTSQRSVLSPLDTYELSDREQSDSDSDSDNESSSKPKKRIPSWAQKANLIPALEKQYTASRNKFDPDEIFGEVQTCDLQAIFDQKKVRYQRRTSSGNWNQDRATAAEKLTYKRTMGYKGVKGRA